MGKDRKYGDKVFGIGHKKSELPAGGIRLSIVVVVVGMALIFLFLAALRQKEQGLNT